MDWALQFNWNILQYSVNEFGRTRHGSFLHDDNETKRFNRASHVRLEFRLNRLFGRYSRNVLKDIRNHTSGRKPANTAHFIDIVLCSNIRFVDFCTTTCIRFAERMRVPISVHGVNLTRVYYWSKMASVVRFTFLQPKFANIFRSSRTWLAWFSELARKSPLPPMTSANRRRIVRLDRVRKRV